MKCPACDKDNDKVIESRQNQGATKIRRRRECLICGNRFTSYERIEQTPVHVIKRLGTREKFDIKKLERGVLRALEKRSPPPDVGKLLHELEDEVMKQSGGSHEIRSQNIGEIVLEQLFEVDQVAYVRFASVYRKFEEVGEFIRVIDEFSSRTP